MDDAGLTVTIVGDACWLYDVEISIEADAEAEEETSDKEADGREC